ncbi:hypothetical protein E4U57_000691 [Claviceps arundinis]|uniref:Uncharacterized protein n=1 Tax=Claviceps arundinis TaxID=1623583 RepID=A0ABQ7PLM4_9HYPO|nr:hypothetical protein E4U57_000691 [Claviceps arundinis]
MSAAVSPAPPLKLPSLAAIGSFDGTADAGRWLEKVGWAFKLNDGLDADASTLVRVINMSLERDAATFVDSSEVLRHIVQQAHQGLATPSDLVTFQRVELQQDYDEPLAAYHSRVVNTLQRAGGRDKPLSNAEPLTSLEINTLRDYINRFVRGLYDKSIMQEAISFHKRNLRVTRVSAGDVGLHAMDSARSLDDFNGGLQAISAD